MINYYLLTKPGIILGNLITLAAGFLLASKGVFHFALFIETFIGLALTMASAGVYNNYIDQPIDRKMERTKNRPLITGMISGRNALRFATILGFLGIAILAYFTNFLSVLIAGIGFFVYVVIYSYWKSHTVYSTAIGSIAGAIPPVVGYTAVSNELDTGAAIFFAMMVFWQMPHFFAIALFRFKDYAAAELPLLPLKKGIVRTKIHMGLYILAFMLTAILLTVFNYTGNFYLLITLIGGSLWLALSLVGFLVDNHEKWGRQMFFVSLIIIFALCFVIPFDIRI
jgi:heme o synthase